MNRCEQAVGYHKKGFNCCQSVLATFQDVIGLTETQCLTLGGGFGAGAGTGELCGAVTGAVMVLDLHFRRVIRRGKGRGIQLVVTAAVAESVVVDPHVRGVHHRDQIVGRVPATTRVGGGPTAGRNRTRLQT